MMNVKQMSAADLLRESKQAMALAMGSVGPDTQARWSAVMAEIDLRLAVDDLDEDDLEGRVQAAVKAATETAVIAVAEKRAAMDERDRAHRQIRNNATNLQFVQEAFNDTHPALAGEWGADLSRGALLLWDWNRQIGKGLLQEFPLFDENGLDPVVHCCEWSLNQDRKRLHGWLKENGHV